MSEAFFILIGVAVLAAGLGIIALHFRVNEVESANEARWKQATEWMRVQEEINKENNL